MNKTIPTPRTVPDPSTLRVLVVDDHGFQRKLVERFLRLLGVVHVTTAANGRAALEAMRTAQFDIVVSDLDMPGMDGMELIRHLGETGSEASLIVSSCLDRSVIASVETMAQAYGVRLLGTVDKSALAARLAEVIARHGTEAAGAAEASHNFGVSEIVAGLERGQFEPFFQPKVDMRTRRVVGAEALARWRHPTRGLVAPEHFVPVLEHGGAIPRLSDAMLRGAIAACRAWRSTGLEASVAVNVSQRCVEDVALADRMQEMVREQGIEPGHVLLEVTETLEAAHLGRALETFSRLRMRGFGLSIDDYGTGYASMRRLARIPFTELKIDRGFVRPATHGGPNRAVIESSLEMAAKLGITAVAEGVETAVEWELLRELGCPLAQGYYIAAPMPVDEFIDWASRRKE